MASMTKGYKPLGTQRDALDGSAIFDKEKIDDGQGVSVFDY